MNWLSLERLFAWGLIVVTVVTARADDGRYVKISNEIAPSVQIDVKRDGDALLVKLQVEAFQDEIPRLQLGLHAAQTIHLTEQDATVSSVDRQCDYLFRIPSIALVQSARDWDQLRLALAVEWPGPAGTPVRLRQSYFQSKTRASHSLLSESPLDWDLLDLEEWEQAARDRQLSIVVPYHQPVEGKGTVVIEAADGRRVRNLISGYPLAKGDHRLVWDGLDENGIVVPPGEYRWRSIAHEGLKPIHVLDFADAPGSNHGTLHAVVAADQSLYFASPVAEGGHEIIELDTDGKFLRGLNPPNGHGLTDVALAVDDQFLYVAHDGTAWGDKIDKTKANWKGTSTLSLLRIDRKNWSVTDYPGKRRIVPLAKHDFGPGAADQRSEKHDALAGMAVLGDRIYLADAVSNEILIVNAATAVLERSLPFQDPVALAAFEGNLYAIGSGKLWKLSAETGSMQMLFPIDGAPAGLAVTSQRFYISDQGQHVIREYHQNGKQLGLIGIPGGIHPGPYESLRFQNPNGLAVSGARLWITEKGRWEPKRFSAFDLKTRKIVREYFGPTNYGAQDAGFDNEDHERWLAQGTLFHVDFASGKATPQAITGGASGRRHVFYRQDGRTFILTSGKATSIQELKANGTLQPLALISSAHQFSYYHHWQPPQSFIEAFQRDYPKIPLKFASQGDGLQSGQPGHGYGMLWVDRNGDSEMQSEEIEFSTAADNLAGSGWSHDSRDLTLRIPGVVQGKKVLVVLQPDGWWQGGAPRYPALNDAVQSAIPVDFPGSSQIESIVDRFGSTILNSTPEMTAFDSKGKRLWSYRNEWSGVHGSHSAPLPDIGQLQGSLFFSGMVPLDHTSDVFAVNGNMGRLFLFTSDGLYLDEMFPDMRMTTNPLGSGIGILGQECFGGTFGRSELNGEYYFQGGGVSYRVYRIAGLKHTVRQEGKLVVTSPQADLAERSVARRARVQTSQKSATIPWATLRPQIDGGMSDWKEIAPVASWDQQGRFPVTVQACHDQEFLYLMYRVADDSPWVNNGQDWQTLFKTGDGIDLQLATFPDAPANRTGPAPGDLRLYIAPSAQGEVACLYRHRVPGATDSEGVYFQSPWRSERVDVVKKLETIQIAVDKGSREYRVEVAIPLQELGLSNISKKALKGDFGVIYGNVEGTVNLYRNYWSNPVTGLVNDVPGEIMLNPQLWGTVLFSAPQ